MSDGWAVYINSDTWIQDVDMTTACVENHEPLSQHGPLFLLKMMSICLRDNSEVAIDALSGDSHKNITWAERRMVKEQCWDIRGKGGGG